MKKILKKEIWRQSGITLIALIITVVTMLILAGVAISAVVDGDGLFSKIINAVGVYEQASQNEADQIASIMNELDEYFGNIPLEPEKKDVKVNAPKMTSGMIPVKYDAPSGKWVKADETNANKDWYNYASAASENAVAKQWANIVTVKETGSKTRTEYLNASVGTTIADDDILTFFVWIPRYAYSITNGYKQIMDGTTEATTAKIDIDFLVGTSNKNVDNKEYPKDYDATKLSAGDTTPMIVHPAFTFGTKELEGIWVAKFEASGVNDLTKTDTTVVENWTNYVGNRSETSSTPVAVTDSTVLTIKPSVPSWRDITIGDAQTQSMKLTNSTSYGWGTNIVDGHLMKNSEWGAVAYLCYSNYGTIPMINGCGVDHKNASNVMDYRYNFVTGAGPKTASDEGRYDYNSSTFIAEHSYSTSNGKLASTTGNIYGIYDMSGGNWERVAGFLDNGNYNLKINAGDYFDGTGGTTVDSVFKGDRKYWDIYEVGADEKANAIKITDSETLTQTELWNTSKYQLRYNEARKRITGETVDNMISHKGDAMYERITTGEYSFYSPYMNGSTLKWDWFKVAYDEPNSSSLRAFGRSWNSDWVLIGHSAVPFVVRGGNFGNGANAGVCYSVVTYGNANFGNGFRPVLAF